MVALLFFLPCAWAREPQGETMIRVGLLTNQYNLTVSSDAGLQLSDAAGRCLLRFKPQEKLLFSIKNHTITVNGKTLPTNEASLTIRDQKSEHFIVVDHRAYRGKMEIHRTNGGGGLTIVNTLPLEQYLYGVVGREIPPEWPVEALKAQAVAARSYALYSLDRFQNDGYDVTATAECQVYGGRDSEFPSTTKAVDDTRGLVIMYQGKVIPALFHASSGGYTENSENVWGVYYPFLRGVVDYDQHSPYFKWKKTFSPAEMEKLLLAAGYHIGTLRVIEISPLTPAPVYAPDRGISGRVKTIRFIGSLGTAQINGGEKLRQILDLHSSLLDVHIEIPPQSHQAVSEIRPNSDIRTMKIGSGLPAYKERKVWNHHPGFHYLSGRPGERIVLTGYGWGHGLGLSQWGAKAMAERAPAGDATYFEVILKHYYHGVEICKLY
jgi:stage II sporulation protein D